MASTYFRSEIIGYFVIAYAVVIAFTLTYGIVKHKSYMSFLIGPVAPKIPPHKLSVDGKTMEYIINKPSFTNGFVLLWIGFSILILVMQGVVFITPANSQYSMFHQPFFFGYFAVFPLIVLFIYSLIEPVLLVSPSQISMKSWYTYLLNMSANRNFPYQKFTNDEIGFNFYAGGKGGTSALLHIKDRDGSDTKIRFWMKYRGGLTAELMGANLYNDSPATQSVVPQ